MNNDWKNTPDKINYKLNDGDDHFTATIDSINEFGIGNLVYKRFDVSMDTSSNNLDELSYNKNPEFKKETLFLKLLIDGEAKLLRYNKENFSRYFYSVNNGPVEQLIFKLYKVRKPSENSNIKSSIANNENALAYNNAYKQQLLQALKCDNLSEKDTKRLTYNEKELTTYFLKYNSCIELLYLSDEQLNRLKQKTFGLIIRPGVKFSSLIVKNEFNKFEDIDFGSQINFRIGIMLEFSLPFRKNAWSLFIEPTYQYFKAETEYLWDFHVINPILVTASVNYQSLQLPFGVRYYILFNKIQSKIFLNLALATDFAINSYVKFGDLENLEIKKTVFNTNLNFGLGYTFKDKLIVEFLFATKRDIFGDSFINWNTEYNTFSVIVGYNIF